MAGMVPWMGMDGWRWYMPFAIGRWLMVLITVVSLVSVVLGIVAIYAYQKVRPGQIKTGGLVAIVLGVIMLATTHWLTGLLTLVGGILCYTSR
jgi:hypothetical protein